LDADTAVWTQEDAKDHDHMIEAALRKEFKCQVQKEVRTEKVQDALDDEDAKLPSEMLSDLIDKGVKKELAKQVVVIKRQMRKTLWARSKSRSPGRKEWSSIKEKIKSIGRSIEIKEEEERSAAEQPKKGQQGRAIKAEGKENQHQKPQQKQQPSTQKQQKSRLSRRIQRRRQEKRRRKALKWDKRRELRF
jgi:hypothetical protein